MIVVTTDYDPVTQSLALVATRFVTTAGAAHATWPTAISGPTPGVASPDRAEVQRPSMPTRAWRWFSLATATMTSHPQPGFHGQDRAPALDPAGAAMLRNRVVVAVCCYSLNAMATAATGLMAHTILGYNGRSDGALPNPTGPGRRDSLLLPPAWRPWSRARASPMPATRRAALFRSWRLALRQQNHVGYQVASVRVKHNASGTTFAENCDLVN